MDGELKPLPKIGRRVKPFSFVGKTGYFLIAGFFSGGFSAIILLGLQTLMTKLGIECSLAFKIVFAFCAIATLTAPYLFIKYFAKVDFTKVDMTMRLVFFNIAEYIFIQGGLALFYSNANTLYYATDGQNGMELIFFSWLALPILILLSGLFDVQHKKHLQQRTEFTQELQQ
ncbi:MAG: hypothetical protein IPP71_23960 [Bacteroidetes bacterium]|nr:hypothetical protein [Bacteroidota bacterium]